MYLIIWRYQVKPEHLSDFLETYSSNGAWAKLFGKSEGYLGTELLQEVQGRCCYATIDRWESLGDFNTFKEHWKMEYDALDAQCENMTEAESLIGRFDLLTS